MSGTKEVSVSRTTYESCTINSPSAPHRLCRGTGCPICSQSGPDASGPGDAGRAQLERISQGGLAACAPVGPGLRVGLLQEGRASRRSPGGAAGGGRGACESPHPLTSAWGSPRRDLGGAADPEGLGGRAPAASAQRPWLEPAERRSESGARWLSGSRRPPFCLHALPAFWAPSPKGWRGCQEGTGRPGRALWHPEAWRRWSGQVSIRRR